jgi:single-stranded-DNA-specific exonuclease
VTKGGSGKESGELGTVVQTAHKRIKLRKQHETIAKKISELHKLRPITARILAARGFECNDSLKNFINPTLREGLPAPEGLKNLKEAVELIHEQARTGKRIAICCDFDVDGLSGGAQVSSFLKSLKIPVEVHVPDRFEDGYGLNHKMIEKAAANKCGLLITIDYGTTNLKELRLARELGLKTIVIDHHHVGDHEPPPSDVFVNPQQKGCGFADGVLCASGLAWYLIVALRNRLKGGSSVDAKSYLDLACLGTICDMVPLIGANRIIAKRGLETLQKTSRPGLIALLKVLGIRRQVTCTDVSFGIGPRLNAAGRLVHGDMVIELLTTDDQSTADKIARQLNDLNGERQDTEIEVKNKAIAQLTKRGTLEAGIVVWDENFHTGVIGIVAQRLTETFYRPAAVLGQDSKGIFKGSVRGIKGFSVVEALGAVSEHLIKYGGHEGAGGFAVEEKKLHRFSEAFIAECGKRLKKLECEPCAEADTEVQLNDLDVALVDELRQLAPFGMGNPQPLVLVKNLRVVDVRDIKATHLKTTLTDGTHFVTGIMWRQVSHPAIKTGARVNVVCRPDYTVYNGITELQANLQAIEQA